MLNFKGEPLNLDALFISSVQFRCTVVSHSVTPWTAARLASLSITNSQSLLNIMSIKSVMPFNDLILWSSPFPPAFNLFQRVSSSHQVAKVLEFQFQHPSFQWIFRLISFRMDWLDLLEVQGTLKGLIQNHSSKALFHWHSGFFMVQLSHPYMTTGKTIGLTRQTFVSKYAL